MLLTLRLTLYAQFLLGIGRFFGIVTDARIWELHLGLGVAIAILAIIALRPSPQLADPGPRPVARFMPLLPLALGLALRFDLAGGLGAVLAHMALGLVTIALVEAAAGRERRALTSRRSTSDRGTAEPAQGSPKP